MGLFEQFSLLIYVFIYAGEANYYLFGWVLGVGTGMVQERLQYFQLLRIRAGQQVKSFKCWSCLKLSDALAERFSIRGGGFTFWCRIFARTMNIFSLAALQLRCGGRSSGWAFAVPVPSGWRWPWWRWGPDCLPPVHPKMPMSAGWSHLRASCNNMRSSSHFDVGTCKLQWGIRCHFH